MDGQVISVFSDLVRAVVAVLTYLASRNVWKHGRGTRTANDGETRPNGAVSAVEPGVPRRLRRKRRRPATAR